jgi:hypothetical protein
VSRQYQRSSSRYNQYLELRTRVLVEQKGRCGKCNVELFFFHYLIPKIYHIDENPEKNYCYNFTIVCKSFFSEILGDIDFWLEEIKQQELEANKMCVICGEEGIDVYADAKVLCKDCRVKNLQHGEELGIRVRIKANGQNFSSNEG